MRVTIQLHGHSERYLGVFHVLFDNRLALIAPSERDVEEKLAGVEYDELVFETCNAVPVPKPMPWIEEFMGKPREYEQSDHTARKLVLKRPRSS